MCGLYMTISFIDFIACIIMFFFFIKFIIQSVLINRTCWGLKFKLFSGHPKKKKKLKKGKDLGRHLRTNVKKKKNCVLLVVSEHKYQSGVPP